VKKIVNGYACGICGAHAGVLGVKRGVTAFRCKACGFVWKNLETLPVDYRETWRYGSQDSAAVRNMDEVYAYRLQQILNASRIPSGKILDFGCGSGGFVRYLRSKGYNAFGCDLGESIPGEQFFFKGDIRDLAENEFDAVVSIETFEHIQELHEVVGEIAKRIKKGGVLYIETHFTHIGDVLGWGYFDLVNHISFHNPKSMKVLMAKAGVDLVYHDDRVLKKNTLWLLRKFVHLTHVYVPWMVQDSSFYKSFMKGLESLARISFGKRVEVPTCDNYVTGVLLASNCVFIGIKK
jgi:SAM-dependent methyltransferase